MEKITFTIIILIILLSCSNDDNQIELKSFNLEEKIELKKSTDFVTPFFQNLGATEIIVTKNTMGTNYKASSKKQFKFNGEFHSLSDFTVIFKDGYIVLERDERYKISLNDNNIAYIVTPEFSGYINQSNEIKSLKNIKTFILLTFLKEITSNNSKKINLELSLANKTASCGYWNTYYSIGVGLTEPAAQADLEYEVQDAINSGDANGCEKIGEPSAIPFSGGTVWAQAWCC
ncbi:hypothetical protein MHL31_15180 [Lutibacter sp. A80]|uniref:hypothetical protein n=1 Tax=Lutibacter sp. A80 TaxID=2918453 RepID=UPI001F0702A1|nr:hypothetical protein [Lutibacter sp. A80]UMB60413.1 hypothetical protein MHL31_15180 [Lutibacter sp. A80]